MFRLVYLSFISTDHQLKGSVTHPLDLYEQSQVESSVCALCINIKRQLPPHRESSSEYLPETAGTT